MKQNLKKEKMIRFFRKGVSLIALAFLFFPTFVLADNISGAGATFPYPVYVKWAEAYLKETGNGLNYQAIGSGAGIKQIKEKTLTFGATDQPLPIKELEENGLVQWPMIVGGVVPIVNIKGINANELVLDGALLADIYLGKIAYWDDPAIVKLNPNLKMPHQPIAPIQRADGSGTNFLFTHYLSAVSPEFASKVGANTLVQWPVGFGTKGNEGVASMTSRTQGAIGYVEYAYALQSKMATVKMINKEGKAVAPNRDSFAAAAENADWKNAPGFYLILTNQRGVKSWPITGASFILMRKEPVDAAQSKQALNFFAWAFQKGGEMAQALDYIPMPSNVVPTVKKSWELIKIK